MVQITVLPHPRMRALGGGRKKRDGGIHRLITEGGLVEPTSLQSALALNYRTDAHFAQYALWTDDGPFGRSCRIKHGSLDCIEAETPFHVRASILAVDIDLKKDDEGNKTGWTVEEYERWLEEELRPRSDEAAYASAYRTAHGARLVWQLKHDFILVNDTVRIWRRAYQKLMAKLGPIGPNGEEPDKVCADYTRLFRLPNVLRDGVPQEGAVSWCDQPLDLDFAPQDAARIPSTRTFTRAVEPVLDDPLTGKVPRRRKKKAKAKVEPQKPTKPQSDPEPDFEPLAEVPIDTANLPHETSRTVGQGPVDTALGEVSSGELAYQLFEAAERRGYELLDEMETDPIFVWALANPVQVPYGLWRALGTNYYACGENVPDRGKSRFHALSELDGARYDEANVDRYWESIEESSQDYGPITYGTMRSEVGDQLWAAVYGSNEELWPLDGSSPAGQVFRSRTDPVLDLTRGSAAQGGGGDGGDGGGDDDDEGGLGASPEPTGPPSKLKGGTETIAQVKLRLRTKTIKEGDTERKVFVRDQDNMVTILAYDKRFGTLRRNLLGMIDEYRGKPITDEQVMLMRYYIFNTYRLDYSYDEVYRFVRTFCSLRAYQPVADYLDALSWDGADRIDELLDCIGLPGDKYARRLLRRWMISAVVRPLNYYVVSGTKVDTVLVLKGDQGEKKSSFFESLMPNRSWFSDSLPSIEHAPKDAAIHMLGAWLIECAEFEGHISRSSVETMKAFVTRSVERFRPPYGRAESICARPSLLVGTTNSETFLHDPTGDRRFWVLPVVKCDVPRVRQIRDQLWAQAVAAYRNGVQWWLTETEDLERRSRNQPFRHQDPVEHYIDDWMAKQKTPPNDFTTEEVLQQAFGKNRGEANRGLLTGIGAVLARKGYRVSQVRGPNGVRVRKYRHPDIPLLSVVLSSKRGPVGG